MAKTPVEVHNSYCYIPDTAPHGLIGALDLETAYVVDGAEHSDQFKHGWWDGKEHLLKKSRKTPRFFFPTGILPILLKNGIAGDMEFIDCRRPLGAHREFKWHGHEPRGFQLRATEAAILARGPGGLVTGRGLLNLPIRSGKTTVAAMIIARLGLKTLFLVPSDLLLHQTVDSMKENLGEEAPIGKCGDGIWEPNFITVATVQTLLARSEAYASELQETVDITFQDEAHHLDAPEWRKPITECDSRYKFGLSATIFANKDIPAERSAIWLQAATGPILYRISMQYLFNHGYLIRPHILWYRMDQPTGKRSLWYADAYNQCIEVNEYRNSAIADLAEEATLDRKLRVLVDTGRLKQMSRIKQMLSARGVRVEEISGTTPAANRRRLIAGFRSNEIQCLVGTVLGEGIDIPELEMVINAEGNKSKTAVIQRMRNLTPPPKSALTKTEVLFIDFNDVMNHKLAEHSAQRLAMYKGIRGFLISDELPVGPDGRYHLPKHQGTGL